MDDILNTYKEIQVANRKNSIKTISMTVLLAIMVISFAVVSLMMYQRSLSNTLILDHDGSVRNAQYIKPDDANIIRCQAFIDDFSNRFFAFNSYNLEDNLQYSLELGDNTIKQAYQWFSSNNWYNNIIQNNLTQVVNFENLNVQAVQGGYVVKARANVTIIANNANKVDYLLVFACHCTDIKPQYPKFKQGLVISNFTFKIKEIQ